VCLQCSAAEETFYPSNLTASPDPHRGALFLAIVSISTVQFRSTVIEPLKPVDKNQPMLFKTIHTKQIAVKVKMLAMQDPLPPREVNDVPKYM